MNYTWDILKWVEQMLPTFLRKENMITWLYVLLKPLRWQNAGFQTYRGNRNYYLGITGSKASLERLLNGRFDSQLNRIYITDATELEYVFWYLDEEEQLYTDLYLDSEIPSGTWLDLYLDEEYESAVDFTVWHPGPPFLAPDAGFRAVLDKWKFAGTTYEFKVI